MRRLLAEAIEPLDLGRTERAVVNARIVDRTSEPARTGIPRANSELGGSSRARGTRTWAGRQYTVFINANVGAVPGTNDMMPASGGNQPSVALDDSELLRR
jgi:hypothetical protein